MRVVDWEEWWKKAEHPMKLPKPERPRSGKRKRADRRRLEKELKRIGWDSVKHFEADVGQREWPSAE